MPELSEEQKDAIIKRRGSKSGKTGIKHPPSGLEIHHRNRNPRNNNPQNLVVLTKKSIRTYIKEPRDNLRIEITQPVGIRITSLYCPSLSSSDASFVVVKSLDMRYPMVLNWGILKPRASSGE